MWTATLRDLQWRKRRFAIAVAGTALVFAMTLLASGVAASFRAEARDTIASVGADTWLVRDGASGPFTGLSALPESLVETVAAMAGVRDAAPMAVVHQVIEHKGTKDVNVLGLRPGGLGFPTVRVGRSVAGPGEAVVDAASGLGVGDTFSLAGRRTTVVGVVQGLTLSGGNANVYVPLADVQAVAFAGQPVAMAILVHGRPDTIPPGLEARTPPEIEADLLRPLARAMSALDLLRLLLWIVAAALVGSVIYLSALERLQDFAVFRATGVPGFNLGGGLALQAVVVAMASALLGVAVARLLAPVFPLPLAIPGRAVAMLPVVAIAVGLVASGAGLRRATTVDPALAFGAAA